MICISVTPQSRRFAKADLLNASRQCDLIELCLDLFYDEKVARLKKGVAGSVNKPGSFRRLVSIISPQLYMNFDLYEMPSQRIQDILPREFEKWFEKPA